MKILKIGSAKFLVLIRFIKFLVYFYKIIQEKKESRMLYVNYLIQNRNLHCNDLKV